MCHLRETREESFEQKMAVVSTGDCRHVAVGHAGGGGEEGGEPVGGVEGGGGFVELGTCVSVRWHTREVLGTSCGDLPRAATVWLLLL